MPQTYDYWDDASPNVFQVPQGGGQTAPQPLTQGPSAATTSSQPTSRPQSPSSQQNPQQQASWQPQENSQKAQSQYRSSAGGASASSPTAAASPSQQFAQVAYVPVQQLPQKKGHGWIVAIVIVVCLFAFTALCVKSCSDVVTSSGAYGAAAAVPDNAIAVIDIDGTIQYDGSANSPEGLKSLLDEAQGNANIKAVVLRVNSGGGTATAGEEMADYVRDFEKPVVVSSASINASAAYEISSQADYIYVAKSTEIGAIGTAMELTDISGLLDMLGVNMEVITSADSKDSSYGYRPLTDEERDYYQHIIDQINDLFVENVAVGRSMAIEDVRVLANGLVYTGIDAVDNGLADEVGTLEDAIAKAAELADVGDYEKYDLFLGSSSLSDLYYLLGGSGQDSSQSSVPMLKQ